MSDALPPLDDHGFASVTNAVLSHFPFGPVKTNDGLKMHTPPPTSTWHAHRLLPPSALSHCLVGLNGVVRRIYAGSRLTARQPRSPPKEHTTDTMQSTVLFGKTKVAQRLDPLIF